MSVKYDFERDFEKVEPTVLRLSTTAHIKRLAYMLILLLGSFLYLYISFILEAFKGYTDNVVFSLLQTAVTFTAIVAFSWSAFRISQALTHLTFER